MGSALPSLDSAFTTLSITGHAAQGFLHNQLSINLMCLW